MVIGLLLLFWLFVFETDFWQLSTEAGEAIAHKIRIWPDAVIEIAPFLRIDLKFTKTLFFGKNFENFSTKNPISKCLV